MAETFVTKFSEQIALNIELTEESVGIFVAVAYRLRQPLLSFVFVLAVYDAVIKHLAHTVLCHAVTYLGGFFKIIISDTFVIESVVLI